MPKRKWKFNLSVRSVCLLKCVSHLNGTTKQKISHITKVNDDILHTYPSCGPAEVRREASPAGFLKVFKLNSTDFLFMIIEVLLRFWCIMKL